MNTKNKLTGFAFNFSEFRCFPDALCEWRGHKIGLTGLNRYFSVPPSQVMDMLTGEVRKHFTTHLKPVRPDRFRPDGTKLVAQQFKSKPFWRL